MKNPTAEFQAETRSSRGDSNHPRSASSAPPRAKKSGWQIKTLGEVCAFDKAQGIHRGLPYVGLEHIESHTARFIGSNEPQPVKSSTFRFSDKHVLYGRLRPYLNKALAPDFDGHCSTEIFPLKPCPELSREYLLFWLLADETCERINATCTGARMPRAQMNDVLGFSIPVPPLAEQQRIVGLLDEALEGLATAKANAEKNLQNARALFESHLQSVFTQRGPGWVEKSLGETCVMYQPKTIGTKDLVPDGPYPVFGANGVIGRYDKFNHEEPQLLVTCRGATCGSVNVSEPNSWITGNAMVVRPKDHALDLHFLEFVIRGGINISAAITGAAQPQITRTNLSPLLIRFPQSVTEQARLADRFEDLSAETQRLARVYERKLAALEALKKSLLHQAFTGEL
jgi:type I restriction enzyme S subunit